MGIGLVIDFILSILRIATWAVPLAIGLAFLLRKADSYEDSYAMSRFKGMGVSLSAYKLLFRAFGAVMVAAAAALFYIMHMDTDQEPDDADDFWKKIDQTKSSDSVFRTAMLIGAIAIPARMGSTRFPGKPLAKLGGKRVIEWVYERCAASKMAEGAFILTDSPEIRDFAGSIGAKCIMTSPECKNGTERIVEALPEIGAEFIVNVQGDEPFVPTQLIDSIFELRAKTSCGLATAATPIEDPGELFNPNNVKVLTNAAGEAIYFSRSPLPYVRGESDPAEWLRRTRYLKHIGIYGYSREALEKYSALPPSRLEACESLEQLRFLDAGMRFSLVESGYRVVGIDTPEDLERAEGMLSAESGA